MPLTPAPLNTYEAADEINRLLAARGVARRVASRTLEDWRLDKEGRKGPRYRKINRWFVEYDPAELARWVAEEYAPATAAGLPAEPAEIPA